MKLLVVDGNSILNRAFYGIRLLSTKDGRYTNGIYGFMNIFLSLLERTGADCAAVAFDLKAPTFRHKMYDGYKAGRKPAPKELVEQFEPLKEILSSLGYTVVEKEGYEADDILGTLSRQVKTGDFCYIATGDRDSLQLVKDNVHVLLTSTKMGQPVTVEYDTEKILEEYKVKDPLQLIDIKAIQGDTSDNIPGVAGIGQKGASELISKFGSVEYIYNNISKLDIKPAMKIKLEADRDNAFLSKKLGRICLDAPIDTDISSYAIKAPDEKTAISLLSSLEMFKIIKRLNFCSGNAGAVENSEPQETIKLYEANPDELLSELRRDGRAYFTAKTADSGIVYLLFKTNGGVALLRNGDFSFFSFVSEFFADEKIEKYTSNLKELYAFCDTNGTELNGVKLDTELAGYILNPNSSDYSVSALCGVFSLNIADIDATGLEAFYEENRTEVTNAASIASLSNKLISEIKENSQEKLLYEIEIPLARVLSSMEREGFSVDKEGISAYGETLSNELSKKLLKIYDLGGCEFNVNSPKQLGEVLFSEEHLGLPHGKKTKSGYSTNAEVLESLKEKHPIINEILEYRTLSKLKSTYCDGLLKVVDNDGRIHSTLNQTETRTGRISSAEPNLQNIPVRTELGRELRRFFNAKDGFVLVDADYSQIELRVLAAMAHDETMIKAFNSGDDIHAITASQVFSVPIEEVTPADRRRAKAVNFGIVYGIGAFSLSKDINVSVKEADRYIKSYLANYSGVARFMEKCKSDAKEKGYAETLFGRRRYLPELTASNAVMRAFGERVAMNMPIQGTAADIIKIAMIKVYSRLKREVPEAHLIMQVHDELIIEAPESRKEDVEKLLKAEMENAVKLSVPLTVDVHSGKTWYETK